MRRIFAILVLGTALGITGCSWKRGAEAVPGMPVLAPIPKDRPIWTKSTEPETKNGKIWLVGRSSGMKIEAAAILAAEMNARSRYSTMVRGRINQKAASVLGHELEESNQFLRAVTFEASSASTVGIGENGGQLVHIERYIQQESDGHFKAYTFDVWVCIVVTQDRFRSAILEGLDRVKRTATDQESRKLVEEMEKDVKSGEFYKSINPASGL